MGELFESIIKAVFDVGMRQEIPRGAHHDKYQLDTMSSGNTFSNLMKGGKEKFGELQKTDWKSKVPGSGSSSNATKSEWFGPPINRYEHGTNVHF